MCSKSKNHRSCRSLKPLRHKDTKPGKLWKWDEMGWNAARLDTYPMNLGCQPSSTCLPFERESSASDVGHSSPDLRATARWHCSAAKVSNKTNWLKGPNWAGLTIDSIYIYFIYKHLKPLVIFSDFLTNSAHQSTFEMLCQKKTCRKKTSRSSSQIQGHGSSWHSTKRKGWIDHLFTYG